jgi:Promethin
MPSATNVATKNISNPGFDIIPKKLIEQFGQVRQQATHSAQQMSQVASNKVGQARSWIIEIVSISDKLRDYVNRYPPLAAFLFTLMALSAAPLGIFALFGLITASIFLSIALIGFGIVEGFFLMTGGTILMAVLGGITLITTIGFIWGAAIYAAYKGGSDVLGRFSESAGYLSKRGQETFQRIQQQHFGGNTPTNSSPLRS